jgi:hypothetical protein
MIIKIHTDMARFIRISQLGNNSTDEIFEISREGALHSGVLRGMTESSETFPVLIPGTHIDILKVVLDFCEKSARNPERSDFTIVDPYNRTNIAHLAEWHAEFIMPHERSFARLSSILIFADYLDIPDLVQLAAREIAIGLSGTARWMQAWMNAPIDGLSEEQIKEARR